MEKLKILPIKTNSKKTTSKIPDPIPKPPFTINIVAPTKSGKTVAICNMIYRWFKSEFDEIIYISPTCTIDKTLQNNITIDDDIVKVHDKDDLKNIDSLIEEIVESQNKKGDDKKDILIVLDDMIAYFKKTKSTLDDLPALSRHYNISFIVVSQVFTAFGPRLRKNAGYYMIYRIINKKDLEAIREEIGSNFEDFDELYKEALDEKYSFLFLDNTEMKAYKRFEKLLWEK
jgi:DNA helicase HerA-like ATPase